MAICHEIGQREITSIQYKGRGQYAVELKTKELVQKIATKGLQLPGAIERAPVKPRRNTVLQITIKTDALVLNDEIEDALRPYGKIVNINYGYYNNNKTIRDRRRLIHIIPTVDIDKIPHTVNIDNRAHQLYFRGKTIKPTQQTTQATQELLVDLDISDSEEIRRFSKCDAYVCFLSENPKSSLVTSNLTRIKFIRPVLNFKPSVFTLFTVR